MARKQHQYMGAFKIETVMETLKSEKPIAQICTEGTGGEVNDFPRAQSPKSTGTPKLSTIGKVLLS